MNQCTLLAKSISCLPAQILLLARHIMCIMNSICCFVVIWNQMTWIRIGCDVREFRKAYKFKGAVKLTVFARQLEAHVFKIGRQWKMYKLNNINDFQDMLYLPQRYRLNTVEQTWYGVFRTRLHSKPVRRFGLNTTCRWFYKLYVFWPESVFAWNG